MPDIHQPDNSLPSLYREGSGEGLLGRVGLLPEYQLLQKQVEATTLQKKMEVGKNLPTVAVGAGYNYHNLMDNDRTFAMIFATVSVPISDWWGGSHAVKRRKIAQQKAEEQLDDNAELLKIRMQKSANDVNEAIEQLKLAAQSAEQAEENLCLARDRYRAGTSTMSNLLEAQLLSQQAKDKQTDAYADLQLRLLDYRQATGQ
jgi:outer membrane protein TolC